MKPTHKSLKINVLESDFDAPKRKGKNERQREMERARPVCMLREKEIIKERKQLKETNTD